jgi:hypothetical protein
MENTTGKKKFKFNQKRHKEQIGKIQKVLIPNNENLFESRFVFVSTEKNILSCLNIRNGKIGLFLKKFKKYSLEKTFFKK